MVKSYDKIYTIKNHEYSIFLWLDSFFKFDSIVCESVCLKNIPKKRRFVKIYKE
jgi:hypothetical protein